MFYPIPKGYERNSKTMVPAYLRGFEHYLYVNLDETINDSDFSNWVISLFDLSGNVVAANVGVLSKDLVEVNGFRFYTTITVPVETPPGVYFLAVYNSSDQSVKYQSNCIKVITDSDVTNYALLYFRNTSNKFNFNYDLNQNYNSVFLNLNIIEQQPEITLNQNRERSTGDLINLKTQTAKVLTVEAFYFDEEAGNAMLALSTHDQIKLNDSSVTVKTAYQSEANKKNSVEKGTIEFYDQKFSTINLHG